VSIELSEQTATGSRDRDERLQIKYLMSGKVINSNEWRNSDQYEPSLADSIQSVEWISDNVLRMGRKLGTQPFQDSLVVMNNTSQPLKYLELDYGKNQSFHVFDLAPGEHLLLSASPEFKEDGSSNYFLGFGGESSDGRRFEGTRETEKRQSPNAGPLRFEVTITPIDFR
jgi:hypothetical protein